MPASRTNRSRRSLTFTSVLLLSTALAAPAFAQIEEVVVTAQKRAEDVQTVPIAITAFTAQDLSTKQIKSFDDLQYNVPNVTYARSNFGGGADIQIRGIGITAIGYDAEAGVAVVVDNVFLEDPLLAQSSFYDLSDVEILAGPQSTLYGRGAVGGVISATTAPPDLDAGSAQLMASYGNYNAKEVEGDVNMPLITDELGIRIAGDWIDHSGYVTNVFNNSHPDNEDEYNIRGSLRWEPSSHTTIDLTGSMSNENDSSMRSTKQLCTTDPTGVLGCLPGSAGNGTINPNATFGNIASSQQGFVNTFGNALGTTFGLPNSALLGLFNLLTPPGSFSLPNPRQIYTDFNPIYQAHDQFLSGEWKQDITPWLKADLVFGYDHDSVFSEESYNNVPGNPIPQNNTAGACLSSFTAYATGGAVGSPNLQCAETAFLGTMTAIAGPAYAANYLQYFTHPGELPISTTRGQGIVNGNYNFTPNAEAFDQSDGEANQWSGELRFDTTFQGPLNFRLGGYYLSERTTGDYYVNASTLDYPGMVLGGLLGAIYVPSLCPTGCILAPSYYHNYGAENTLIDKAIYGEAYYTMIPDTLKLTGGLRYSEDDKFQVGRIAFLNGGTLAPLGLNLIPIGTPGTDNTVTGIGTGAPEPAFDVNRAVFREYTGHGTVDWTPKFDFTDQTLVYATYSRGYKAGGFNPGVELGLSVPQTYAPEFINDFELGTKNTLLNGTLQANADLWYYDYTGLQVSQIQNNTSVNQNINAKLYGAEGEFVYQPIDQLQFSLNIAETHTAIGPGTYMVDPRNPTGGSPQIVLIKDDTITASSGENCVLYYTGVGPAPSPATLGIPGYTNPNGGSGADQSTNPQNNIQTANYGPCNPNTAEVTALHAAGFYTAWYPIAVGGTATPGPVPGTHVFQDGNEENLKGNMLQNTPDFDTTFGVQWTQPVGGDYNVVAHVDYYWQSHMYGRIFADGADYIKPFGNMNATVQLNAPDNKWYVQAFIKNVFGTAAVQGAYLTSPTSGLYTNAVYGDPRLFGLKVGIKL
jgi:outer membrane receptor protein involved in Fe transport